MHKLIRSRATLGLDKSKETYNWNTYVYNQQSIYSNIVDTMHSTCIIYNIIVIQTITDIA